MSHIKVCMSEARFGAYGWQWVGVTVREGKKRLAQKSSMHTEHTYKLHSL